jgi:hypothetical protein
VTRSKCRDVGDHVADTGDAALHEKIGDAVEVSVRS